MQEMSLISSTVARAVAHQTQLFRQLRNHRIVHKNEKYLKRRLKPPWFSNEEEVLGMLGSVIVLFHVSFNRFSPLYILPQFIVLDPKLDKIVEFCFIIRAHSPFPLDSLHSAEHSQQPLLAGNRREDQGAPRGQKRLQFEKPIRGLSLFIKF